MKSALSYSDLHCPECGKDDDLTIELRVYAQITPDGTDIQDDLGLSWDRRSEVTCGSCDHVGELRAFEFSD
jgi:hypothetical protein